MPDAKLSQVHFGAYGPYIIGRQGEKVTSEDIGIFWNKVNDECVGLSDAIGVYIAAVQRGREKSLRPVYVGKTDNGFKKRLSDKHDLFQLAKEYSPRRLRLFFLARMESEKGGFKKAVRRKPVNGTDGKGRRGLLLRLNSIARLEFMLIGECVKNGLPLLNTQQAAFHTSLNVAGFVGNSDAGDPLAKSMIKQVLQRKTMKKLGD